MATITHVVTVENYLTEGNRFKIDGVKHPNLFFARGNTYVFDVSDSSMTGGGHAFRFSETRDGTNANPAGSEFTTGVTVDTTANTVTIVVDDSTPDTLYYYCGTSGHTGMAGTYAQILTSGVILTPHSEDAFSTSVTIFSNTLARDIPAKIESISTALKNHHNTELGDITTYINNSLNSILSELNEMAGNIAYEQIRDFARYDAAYEELKTNLGNYTQDQNSYTQAQIQELMFTGAVTSSDISYDSDGRISSILSNGKYIWNITYDSNGNLDGFRENVTIGGQVYTRTYNVLINADNEISAIEEV